MTTVFVPEFGEKPVTITSVHKGIVNLPPFGTPVRATLGDTVIVGTLENGPQGFALVTVRIIGLHGSDHLAEFQLWTDSGWTFEILSGVSA